jgi:hypothetical protein
MSRAQRRWSPVRYNRHVMPQETAALRRRIVPPLGPSNRSTGAAEAKQITKVFENDAGHYELVRVNVDRAHYRFTNRHGKTSEADMPLATWRRVTSSLLEGKG